MITDIFEYYLFVLLSQRHINMLKLWNRLVKMDNSRITKRIFLLDNGKGFNTSQLANLDID